MGRIPSRSGFFLPSARFQQTKSRVCISALQRRMPPRSMRFTRRRCARGGHDIGAPGLRPVYGDDYYAAFIIDPDGYRIEAYYGPGER